MIQVVLCLFVLPFLIDAVRRSGLRTFDPPELALWGGLTLFGFAAQLLSLNMLAGISFHYSAAAFLALTLGYSRALLSMCLLMLITQPLGIIGYSLLINALLPVWLMISLVSMVRAYLPHHLFVYLLGCGFFGLFIVYACQAVAGVVFNALYAGEPVVASVFSEPLAWQLLLFGGEATLEGMLITILVVYYPRAVKSFEDRVYLSRLKQ